MSQLVRKQVYIEPRQENMLKRRAKQLGVPESELIRQGIDRISRDRVAVPLDLRAWQDEKAFIEERRRIVVEQTGRTWTREELYD